MNKRNVIKWLPFNSVGNTKEMINNILLEKQKINKPTLSEDQIKDLNNLILNTYQNKEPIILKYYKNGYIYTIKGTIVYLNKLKKNLFINNKMIYFSQIISIKATFY